MIMSMREMRVEKDMQTVNIAKYCNCIDKCHIYFGMFATMPPFESSNDRILLETRILDHKSSILNPFQNLINTFEKSEGFCGF